LLARRIFFQWNSCASAGVIAFYFYPELHSGLPDTGGANILSLLWSLDWEVISPQAYFNLFLPYFSKISRQRHVLKIIFKVSFKYFAEGVFLLFLLYFSRRYSLSIYLQLTSFYYPSIKSILIFSFLIIS